MMNAKQLKQAYEDFNLMLPLPEKSDLGTKPPEQDDDDG